MYLPAHFAQTDPDALRTLVAAYPFATLVTVADGVPQVEHLPLRYAARGDGHGVLLGHVARANPLAQPGPGPQRALAVFQGPQAYVSPAWYPSKRETGRVVPTWNYAVVHAAGELRRHTDPAWLHRLLAELSAHHEQGRPQPWAIDDAPADYIDRQLAAIVGIELVIDRIVGKWKLSQNRSAADRDGVVQGLRAQGGEQALQMADWVQRRGEG